MSENRVLRRISGTKREKITGRWRKLHNGEPHKLYCSPNIKSDHIINEDKIGRACRMQGRGNKCIKEFS
jgi:hypothetical protein